MFGRATITLGIGPHSSLYLFCVVVHLLWPPYVIGGHYIFAL